MPVAASTLAAAGNRRSLVGRVEVGDEYSFIKVVDHRAWRDVDDHVIPAFAVHFLPHPGLPALGLPVMPACEIEQGVLVHIRDQDDRASIAAITSVGTAFGDVLLASKGDATCAAVAG